MEITRSEWSHGTLRGEGDRRKAARSRRFTVTLCSQSPEEAILLCLFGEPAARSMRGNPQALLRRQGRLGVIELSYDGDTIMKIFNTTDAIKLARKILKEFKAKFGKLTP